MHRKENRIVTIRETFNSAAPQYDALRRKLIPCFDDFYGTAVDLLDLLMPASGEALRILDLGAGTGILSAAVRTRIPEVRLTLVDLAEDMLALARQRFESDDKVEFGIIDYATADLGGPYDAVVSALSIHHLEHPAKQKLFSRIRDILKPGGVFINADQVAGPNPSLEKLYQDVWTARVRAAGVDDLELAAARHRRTHDRLAPLADQLRWLAEAGFADVHCVYKNWSFVVYVGQNPL